MKVNKILLYEDREDVTLTSYIIDDSPELSRGKKRPAILICPGGAYVGCSDREGEPIALRFAAMGYHAFVLRYSTFFEGEKIAPSEFATFIEKENKNCRYPKPMLEIGMAMLLIRKHAEEWQVDMDRIAINGYSAGAHNCAMYANHWNQPIITETLHCNGSDIKPIAVILGYPLTDYLYTQEKAGIENNRMINLAYFGTAEPSEKDLRLASPVLNVNTDTPPTFLWATAEDEMVPVQNTIRMAHALADYNIPFEVHIFEHGQHGLSLADQASAGETWQINNDVAKWVESAEMWLKRRMSLF